MHILGNHINGHPNLVGFCKCEIEVPGIRADFGYDLNYEYWGQGIMTEALGAVLGFAFKTLKVNRVEATVSTENHASARALDKLCFRN